MTKKILMVTGGVVLAGLLVFGTGLLSYVRTTAHVAKETLEDNVPIDFQIERARQLIRDLEPEIRKNMHVIAKEEVEIARLEKQITEAEGGLVQDKTQILRLKTDLANDQPVYEYAGKSFTVEQVRLDLANRFERYKTADATLASLQEIHAARESSLDSARKKLTEMMAARRQLEVEVENLEARLKSIEVAKAANNLEFDDSRLGRAKELVSDLKARLEVTEKLVQSEGYNPGEIPLDEPSTSNIVDEVTAYFTEKPAEGSVANK